MVNNVDSDPIIMGESTGISIRRDDHAYDGDALKEHSPQARRPLAADQIMVAPTGGPGRRSRPRPAWRSGALADLAAPVTGSPSAAVGTGRRRRVQRRLDGGAARRWRRRRCAACAPAYPPRTSRRP
jgi:hypothetical protein